FDAMQKNCISARLSGGWYHLENTISCSGIGCLTVPDQRILRFSRGLCDRTPAKPFLAQFQSEVGVHINGRPTEPHPTSLGCLLPSNDTLPDRAPFQFCNRCEN